VLLCLNYWARCALVWGIQEKVGYHIPGCPCFNDRIPCINNESFSLTGMLVYLKWLTSSCPSINQFVFINLIYSVPRHHAHSGWWDYLICEGVRIWFRNLNMLVPRIKGEQDHTQWMMQVSWVVHWFIFPIWTSPFLAMAFARWVESGKMISPSWHAFLASVRAAWGWSSTLSWEYSNTRLTPMEARNSHMLLQSLCMHWCTQHQVFPYSSFWICSLFWDSKRYLPTSFVR